MKSWNLFQKTRQQIKTHRHIWSYFLVLLQAFPLELFYLFLVTAGKRALQWSKHEKTKPFHVLSGPPFCIIPSVNSNTHSKMSSLLLIERLETWNNQLWLHAGSILFTKCCTCFYKRPTASLQNKGSSGGGVACPSLHDAYVCRSLFELQRRVWVLLSSPMSFRPSDSCTIQTKCFNFAQQTVSFISIICGNFQNHAVMFKRQTWIHSAWLSC